MSIVVMFKNDHHDEREKMYSDGHQEGYILVFLIQNPRMNEESMQCVK